MISFSQLWRKTSIRRHKPDAAATWSKRIADSPKRFGPSNYSNRFLELAALEPGESVFDMGCGAGTLAIPCAQRGHQVLAADFSDAMLSQLESNLEPLGPSVGSLVKTMHLSWEDDWNTADLEPNSFDVAFASRSIITDDLAASIAKLSSIARRKACVTVTTGASPRVFLPLLHDLGLSFAGHPDATFVFAVAIELGYQPEVRYINSERQDFFATPEDAFEKYRTMLPLADEKPQGAELVRLENDLRAWLDEHLIPASQRNADRLSDPSHLTVPDSVCVKDTDILSPKALTTDIERVVPWAFLSWNTEAQGATDIP